MTVTVGTTVQFTGSAVDPEGDSVTYEWIFTGTAVTGTFTANPVSVRFPRQGTVSITLNVTDSNGNRDPTPATLTVTVIGGPGGGGGGPQGP